MAVDGVDVFLWRRLLIIPSAVASLSRPLLEDYKCTAALVPFQCHAISVHPT